MSESKKIEVAYDAIFRGLLKHGVTHIPGNDVDTYRIGNIVKVQKIANDRYNGDLKGRPIPFQISLHWLFVFMQVQLELHNKRQH